MTSASYNSLLRKVVGGKNMAPNAANVSKPRIIERPAFQVVGKKVWISGQDNALFGRFWEQCRADGLFARFEHINALQPGPQTGGITLGISCVEEDPAIRAFYYIIAIENPQNCAIPELENYTVPASQWAVFECRGKVPEAIVTAEMYAFLEWLPNSEFFHANVPEMEVYPPGSDVSSEDNICEFWLPIKRKE
jgi:AraC family transcriptional regulator